MTVYVVDASVAGKWFVDEEHSPAALSLLDGRDELHAPDFLLLELDNVVWQWVRRAVITPSEADRVRAAVRHVTMRLHPFHQLLDAAYAIATRTERTVYDCLYVALADALNARLVTADRRLCNALARTPLGKYVVSVDDIP